MDIHLVVKYAVHHSKLTWIKIRVFPTDTVAQSVEHRRGWPRTWVRILASVVFVPLRSFFLCYPCEALEGPISTRVCIYLFIYMLIYITKHIYVIMLCM